MSTAPHPTVFVPGYPGTVLIDAFGGNRTVFPPVNDVVGPGLGAVLRRLHGPDDVERYDGIEVGGPIRQAVKLLWWRLFEEAEGLYQILSDLAAGLEPGVKAGGRHQQNRWIIERVESIGTEQEAAMLEELGVHVIWYDDHDEVPEILAAVAGA